MKLSPRDQQRLLWGAAILVGVAAVLYACLQLIILPLRQAKMNGMNHLAMYQDQINQANLDLRGLASIRAEVSSLQESVNTATNSFVLRPVLGSLLVSIQNMVEPVVQECGLQLDSCTERSRMELPVNQKNVRQTIERYLTEVTVTGPYAAVRDFVVALEKTNSYVCVTDVEISGQAGDVRKHKVRICMEWPVFGASKEPVLQGGRDAAVSRTEDD